MTSIKKFTLKDEKRKIKASSLAKAFPTLIKISEGNTSEIPRLIKKKSEREIKAICSCVNMGLSSLKKRDFQSKPFRTLRTEREKLRFLSDFSQCSKNKKLCLVHKRNTALIQSGKGIGLILSSILPALADILINQFS